MIRDRIGGIPFEMKKDNGKIVLRFYPKSENAKNPDGVVFVLSLDKDDQNKIKKIVS